MKNRLKEIRKNKNIPVETIIKTLGLETKAAYYKKENGKVKITLDDALSLSNLFDMPVEEIFLDSSVPNRNNIDL